MNIAEVKEINAFLSNLGSTGREQREFPIYVDNVHFPYIELDSYYVLPAFTYPDSKPKEVLAFLAAVAEYIPGAIAGTQMLPIQKPKRESGKMSFVKIITINGFDYLYVFKIDASYLGGAHKGEVLAPATSTTSTSIRTNRIYFSARIVPLREIQTKDGQIGDFDTKHFKSGVFYKETDDSDKNKPKIFSELFDEVDYSAVVAPIKEMLGINLENWKLGKVYEPITIEYLSLSIRFLDTSYNRILKEFETFYQLAETVHTEEPIRTETLENYKIWLRKHDSDRNLSPAGNMRWKILKK